MINAVLPFAVGQSGGFIQWLYVVIIPICCTNTIISYWRICPQQKAAGSSNAAAHFNSQSEVLVLSGEFKRHRKAFKDRILYV